MLGFGTAADAARRIALAHERHLDKRDERHEQRARRRSRMRRELSEQEIQETEMLECQMERDTHRASGRTCPQCGTRFILMEMETQDIDVCLNCGGMWFDAEELRTVTHQDSDVPGKKGEGKRSRYTCPVCGAPMQQHRFQEPHRLLVDTCPGGHGIYLEKGELLKALDISTEAE